MFTLRVALLAALSGGGGMLFAAEAAVYTAAEVVDYQPGSGVSPSLTVPAAVLSLPSASTGADAADGNFSPFNPHYRPGEIVQIGHGGHLTVRLERFVRVEPGLFHLGVWENVFLVATSEGLVSEPPGLFGLDSAVVEVSANGVDFVNVGTVTFTGFGNFWVDSASAYSKTGGTLRADFGRPFIGDHAMLGGASYAQVLEFLDGTGGGTWVDLSSSGLDAVGWVRFSGVAEGLTLEIDAVTINTALAGGPTAIPRLAADRVERGRLVLAHSLPHARYQLQVSDDLKSGWSNYGSALGGTGGELVFNDSLDSRPPARFYRVVLP